MAAKGLARHSTLSTTDRHYVQVVPEETREAMAQLEQEWAQLEARMARIE